VIALSLVIFLTSFGLFLTSLLHAPGLALEQWLFSGEFAVFAGHMVVVVFGSKAISVRRRRGQTLWRFSRDGPRWAGIVQLVLMLAAVSLVYLGPEGRVQRDSAHGALAHCVSVRDGQSVPLDDAGCEALRLSGLRTFTAFWSALSFFAFTQFAFSARQPEAMPLSGA
jgi:hypothetical protein